ncbi:MAG: heavy metal translocating P-type ATPase [Clostridia bacterium]|nr:heavy metal translocating P-type ATPase [Clostridia bacterium]
MTPLFLSRGNQRLLLRIGIALVLFAAVLVIDKGIHPASCYQGPWAWLFPLLLYGGVYVLIGYDIWFKAARHLRHGQALDENFLMCIASLGAFGLGLYKIHLGQGAEGFDEGCAVLLFYQLGEFFQNYATQRSRNSISHLMDLCPQQARVLREGLFCTVDPASVRPGEIIAVNPGERIPLDGTVLQGCSSVDNRALNGESCPTEVEAGQEVLSGGVNLTERLEIRVTKEYENSTVAKILELVENASSQKSETERFITRFARYYTPLVVGLAAALFLLPGLLTRDWGTWLYRALNFLVVSCPCALVISVPMSFFVGIGAASRAHVLVKGSDHLEKLARNGIFVFDKTGTLTQGSFFVTGVCPKERQEELLRLAAIAENGSVHPIAKAILERCSPEEEGYRLYTQAGFGVIAEKEKEQIVCGNEKLLRSLKIEFPKEETTQTAVLVAHNGIYRGKIFVSDRLRKESADVIRALHTAGNRTVMLTGDRAEVARQVAAQAGILAVEASLLPHQKVETVELLLQQRSPRQILCFVGDGINDAPALMRADVGIAMGMGGSDAAMEAADVVLMQNDLRGLLTVQKIARKTMAVVRQNVVFSLGIKGSILLLSALGMANMWMAVFGDVGVAILAVCNAFRVNRMPPKAL